MASFDRTTLLAELHDRDVNWDMLVVGGGATGLGVAVDAAARGYRVALVEQSDFAQATSSRSTKLIHGGVRYLAQGNVSLVQEALAERSLLCAQAAHLVRPMALIVPCYRWWEATWYRLGLGVYDLLAGRHGLGRSRRLSRQQVVQRLPTIATDQLRAGIIYYDAIFDDARLAIELAKTAVAQGACCVNYVRAAEPVREGGRLVGLNVEDVESGATRSVRAKVVVNATGPFADDLRQADDRAAAKIIAPSQGIHLVFAAEFLPGDTALLVPQTPDGRVVFAIPWHDHLVVGTTDTPLSSTPREPRATSDEIDFLLDTVGRYLSRPPTRRDIRSVYAGVRPLVRSTNAGSTAQLSRDHTIEISSSGLVTIAGGKWTTYRNMAEDCVNQAAAQAGLEPRPAVTRQLPIHGSCADTDPHDQPYGIYGSQASEVRAWCAAEADGLLPLAQGLPFVQGQVTWAAHHEMACSVDDVLARRTRALVLDAGAAVAAAPVTAQLLARQLGHSTSWQDEQIRRFEEIARHYLVADID